MKSLNCMYFFFIFFHINYCCIENGILPGLYSLIIGILDFQILFIKRICKKKETIRKCAVFFNYVCEIKVKV